MTEQGASDGPLTRFVRSRVSAKMLASVGGFADNAAAFAEFGAYRRCLQDMGCLESDDDRAAHAELDWISGLGGSGTAEPVYLHKAVSLEVAQTQDKLPTLGNFQTIVVVEESIAADGIAFGVTHVEQWTYSTVVRFWLAPSATPDPTVRLDSEGRDVAVAWCRTSEDGGVVRGEVATLKPFSGRLLATVEHTRLTLTLAVPECDSE